MLRTRSNADTIIADIAGFNTQHVQMTALPHITQPG